MECREKDYDPTNVCELWGNIWRCVGDSKNLLTMSTEWPHVPTIYATHTQCTCTCIGEFWSAWQYWLKYSFEVYIFFILNLHFEKKTALDGQYCGSNCIEHCKSVANPIVLCKIYFVMKRGKKKSINCAIMYTVGHRMFYRKLEKLKQYPYYYNASMWHKYFKRVYILCIQCH